jgi:N,N'-diacetyllegionaminate synthase
MKIIAEVGSNWTTFEHAKDSIAQAKACGADAVKFQAFTPGALYGLTDAFEMRPPYLPLDWLPKLAEKAKACGIEFMCTAFSPELVEAVDPFVQTHKVASAELTHIRLLQAIRKTGKPVLLSTGASGLQDIKNALDVLKPCQVTLMHCVAAYPARATSLTRIKALRDRFELPVGYSDHSTSCDDIPKLAQDMGAVVLEKHVTAFPDLVTPDQPHSLTMAQFKYMVDYLKGRVNALSPGHEEEKGMILRHNRRLIAIRDIAKGARLVEGENFGIYRALKDMPGALSPWAIEAVNGKEARKDIKAGDGIGLGDV